MRPSSLDILPQTRHTASGNQSERVEFLMDCNSVVVLIAAILKRKVEFPQIV